LRAAEKADISYSGFVVGLLRASGTSARKARWEWRIRKMNLPERWALETFPYARQTGREPQADPRLRRQRKMRISDEPDQDIPEVLEFWIRNERACCIFIQS
jgi:hypothetical protein